MVSHAKQLYIAPEEYLRREIKLDDKHEFEDGVIVAMSGGTMEHAFICTNLSETIGPQLRSRACRGVVLEVRIRQVESNRYYYPDYTIVCGKPEYEDIEGIRSLLNPSVIFEVLSPITEKRDRNEKWEVYKRIPTLRTYVLVHQSRILLEALSRPAELDEWSKTEVENRDDLFTLPHLGVVIPVSEIYRDLGL